jgi:hypothetical protein
MPEQKKPTPDEMVAWGIEALQSDSVPAGYATMTPVQFALLMEAHARYQRLRARQASGYGGNDLWWHMDVALKLIEALEDVRNGNYPLLFKPQPRPASERKPRQVDVRKQAFAVIALEDIRASGKSFEDAAREVSAAFARWMGDLAPSPTTVLSWRRWINEEPDKHPELVALYTRAKAPRPGETLPQRTARFLTLISSEHGF